jgi:formylglycine-generating enzyme required for sulfatase activity
MQKVVTIIFLFSAIFCLANTAACGNQTGAYREEQYRLHHILVENEAQLKSLIRSFNFLFAETKDPYKSAIILADDVSKKDPLNRRWGDLGWVSRGKFPKEFDEKVFSLKKEGTYTTFSTPLGYHFVMLMHIRKPGYYPAGRIKGRGMAFIQGEEFYAGFNKKELQERYAIWEKQIKPSVKQDKPGWIEYAYQTYRKTRIKSFYIDKYEVTYGEYKEFLEATGHRPIPEWIEKFIQGDDYPIVGVSWNDADAYCKWKGKRLATQDEWELAARSKIRRKYPWGNNHPDGKNGNFADINSGVPWKNNAYNDGYASLAPVNSYPAGATPEGVYNLGGNAREWTATVNKKNKTAIAKGGSFENAFDDMMTADQRQFKLGSINNTLGFRCVYDDPENKKTSSDRYPVIIISADAHKEKYMYKKLRSAGFPPEKLWWYQYKDNAGEMRNMEELTDGIKQLIYLILKDTKSSKVQILAYAEGAVLAQAAIKKYNLYNLIHACAYIAGPFHGNPEYTYLKALKGFPVSSNLAPDSDFLKDMNIPDETPYNILENEAVGNFSVKYLVIYDDYSSPLTGAINHKLNQPEESSKLYIPFLSDENIKYDALYDNDKDGFMDQAHGGTDCDDNNPLIFPGAKEIPGDNIDQDCNGMDLLPTKGKDCLTPVK